MNPNERMRRWLKHWREVRRRTCRCVWYRIHLCAVQNPCDAHYGDELNYAVWRYQPGTQLRLF